RAYLMNSGFIFIHKKYSVPSDMETIQPSPENVQFPFPLTLRLHCALNGATDYCGCVSYTSFRRAPRGKRAAAPEAQHRTVTFGLNLRRFEGLTRNGRFPSAIRY